MAYPASGLEKTYRNNIDEVAKFMQFRHEQNYLVINLSSREYDYKKFGIEKVINYEWNDHQAPSLITLFNGVLQMVDLLNENINNVVFVHCNAGKGRTGTLICCFFMFVQFMDSTEDARHYYSWKRFTSIKRGVTQPSQIRYIDYFHLFFQSFNQKIPQNLFLPILQSKFLQKIIINSYIGQNKQNIKPVLKIFKVKQNLILYDQNKKEEKFKEFKKQDKQFIIDIEENIFLLGDILIQVEHRGKIKNSLLFRLNLNTYFIEKNNVCKFTKQQIDPDSFQSKINDNFSLELIFQNACNDCQYNKDQQPLCNICEQNKIHIQQEKDDYKSIQKICDIKINKFKSQNFVFGNPCLDDTEEFKEVLEQINKSKNTDPNNDQNYEEQIL